MTADDRGVVVERPLAGCFDRIDTLGQPPPFGDHRHARPFRLRCTRSMAITPFQSPLFVPICLVPGKARPQRGCPSVHKPSQFVAIMYPENQPAVEAKKRQKRGQDRKLLPDPGTGKNANTNKHRADNPEKR